MEFKRFEEETQQKTYQQPIGFSPQTSVSQSGAIGQQYKQNLQSSSFYENSLKSRDAIRQANDTIKEANFQDNDLFKTIDTLSSFLPKANEIVQNKVKEYTKAKEQEGYVGEMQRVYEFGFNDDELAEMNAQQQDEALTNAGFSEAQREAFRKTGNPELAHVIGMKNPYAQAGAARAYAERVAASDPTGLQEALRRAKADNNGDPLSESQIRSTQASYNGRNWVASGLTGFKPTFLGEKYWNSFRSNQEKVISKEILTNRIQQSEIDVEVAGSNFMTDLKAGKDINGLLDTYMSVYTSALDGNGSARSRTNAWNSIAELMGNSDMSVPQIEQAFEKLTDPATGRPSNVTKAKYMQKALKLRQGIIDADKKREKAQVQENADNAMSALQDEADGMEFGSGVQKAAWLQQQATERGLYSDYRGASFSQLTNEINRLKNPLQANARKDYYARQDVIREAELAADPYLTNKEKDILRGSERYESYAENEALKQASKDTDQTLLAELKGISDQYVTTAPNGEMNVKGTQARRMMQILKKDYEFELAQVRVEQENKDKDIARQSVIATERALEKAKKRYGLGMTLEDAKKAGVTNPIMATGRDKALSMDDLNESTMVEQVNAMKLEDPKSYLNVGGDNDSSYRNNLERRTNDWLDGSPALDISPLEMEAMRKFGVPFSDLINMARLQSGLPAIPYSRWEAGLKALKETHPQLVQALLNPNGSVSAKQRALNLMNPTPPATPPAEVRTAQVSGERDAAGNTFSANAVAATYGQTPQQQANVKRMLPSIETASQKTGVPSALIAAHIGTESSFMPRSGPNTRYGNAVGPMQIIPMWHPNMPQDEAGQIEYGANYMNELRYKTDGVHPSAPPVGSYSRGLFLYSGDHNRPYSNSDREYVEGTLNEAYGFGMNELLSSTEMLRPSVQRLFA